MTNFTLDNHLKYSIGGSMFGYRDSPTQKYNVYLGKVDDTYYKKTTFREELYRTADSVRRELGKDLVLFLSGGTDSEIVLRNFLDIGFKPRCVVLDFVGGYNRLDVVEAENIAKELDVSLEKIPFDVIDFYRSGKANHFASEIQCTQITYLMVYYSVYKLSAPSVMGGEVLLTRNVSNNNSFWYYTFRENEDASAMRFSNRYGIPLVNEWFSYTPELLLCYLENPSIKELISNKHNYKLTSVSSKNRILKELYPEIREKVKTHGFERLLGFNFETYRRLSFNQIRRLEPFLDGIEYNQAILSLRGKYED
jgi:hypothetical protein